MNERTCTIALLAHRYCYVATCSYRRANGGNSTHTSTGTTSSTRMAAAQLIHQNARNKSRFKIPEFPFNVAAKTALEKRFVPKVNVVACRHTFRQRIQRVDETVSQYVIAPIAASSHITAPMS